MRLPPKLWHLLHSRAFRRLLIASPFLLALSIIAFYTTINLWGSAKLNQARQSLHNQGHPTTLKELLARNPPPEADFAQSDPVRNQLNIYVHPHLTGLGYKEADLDNWQGSPTRGTPMSASSILAGKITDERVAATKVLADLSTLESDANQWISTLSKSKAIGHVVITNMGNSSLRSGSSTAFVNGDFFMTRARLNAAAGNTQSALSDIKFLTNLIRLSDQDPQTLLTVVIRAGAASYVYNAIWDIASQPAMTDSDLLQLQQELHSIEIDSPAVTAWQIESLLFLSSAETTLGSVTATPFNQLESSLDWSEPKEWWPNLKIWSYQLRPAGYARANIAAAMEVMHSEFIHLPDGRPRHSWTRSDSDRLKAIQDSKPENPATNHDYYAEVLHHIHGTAATTIDRILSINATIRLAILTVAAQRHHRAHGHFPTTIADLIPTYLDAPLIDPMSDQPIRLHPQPDGPLHITAPGDKTRKPITWICPPNK